MKPVRKLAELVDSRAATFFAHESVEVVHRRQHMVEGTGTFTLALTLAYESIYRYV